MFRTTLFPLYTVGVLMLTAAPTQAGLIASNSGATVTDTTNNVMWTGDMSLFHTQAAANSSLISTIIADSGGVIHHTGNKYDTPAGSGTYTLTTNDFNTSSGQMSWFGAQAWIHYLNVTQYQGYSDWRAPSTSSELSALFTQLGQTSSSIVTTHNSNYSLFTNVPANLFWASYEFVGSFHAQSFDNRSGRAGISPEGGKMFELAVRNVITATSGNVPEPASITLLGIGAAALCYTTRRRQSM